MEIWKEWKPGIMVSNGIYNQLKLNYPPILISNLGNVIGREVFKSGNGYLHFKYFEKEDSRHEK